VFAKELLKKEVLLFTYKECKIVSAVPIAEIEKYLCELGAVEKPGQKYEYADIVIEISVNTDNALPILGIQRHTIDVSGDRTQAEEFLNAFRLRFLSAGG
jgi:hypothetical protein